MVPYLVDQNAATTPGHHRMGPFQIGRHPLPPHFEFIVEKALSSLSRILQISKVSIKKSWQSAHLHNWQADPFSRGAYSYVKVGGKNAPQMLGKPVEQTLFFAGEATDTTGHTGTVHGAIASGKRVAEEMKALPITRRDSRSKLGWRR